jgi:MoaA/NifB/PqqE/SkfB family radical SAM enzyme
LLKYKKIFLGNSCNNSCLQCPAGFDIHPAPDVTSVVRSLEQDKGDNIVFYGGEPTLCKELPDIIKSAAGLGYRRIKLISNGRAFSDSQYLVRTVEAGCNLFEIKLFGSNPGIHDSITRKEGSFWQTLQGMENIGSLTCDKFICARIPLFIQNRMDIESIVTLAINLGVHRILLSPADYLTEMKESLPHIRNAINVSVLNRVWILIEGMPFCILKGIEPHISELYYGNDSVSPGDYRQFQACGKCVYREICPGADSRYLERFGHDEFSPVTESSSLSDIKALHE